MDIKENLKLRFSLLQDIGEINLEKIVNSIKETLENETLFFGVEMEVAPHKQIIYQLSYWAGLKK